MSAFMVEDQERQRKMNKMTDGKFLKMILGDVQRIWENLLDTLFYLTLAIYLGKVFITQYSTDNFFE